jgi:hypothetical protein
MKIGRQEEQIRLVYIDEKRGSRARPTHKHALMAHFLLRGEERQKNMKFFLGHFEEPERLPDHVMYDTCFLNRTCARSAVSFWISKLEEDIAFVPSCLDDRGRRHGTYLRKLLKSASRANTCGFWKVPPPNIRLDHHGFGEKRKKSVVDEERKKRRRSEFIYPLASLHRLSQNFDRR